MLIINKEIKEGLFINIDNDFKKVNNRKEFSSTLRSFLKEKDMEVDEKFIIDLLEYLKLNYSTTKNFYINCQYKEHNISIINNRADPNYAEIFRKSLMKKLNQGGE